MSRRIALQGVGFDRLALATQGLRFIIVIEEPEDPPPEIFVGGGGFIDNIPRVTSPYYDEEMEVQDVLKVIQAFLRVTE